MDLVIHTCSLTIVEKQESSTENIKSEPNVIKLNAMEASRESFKEFGQVIEPSAGELFGPNDAQLDISRGIPRFCIIPLRDLPLKFSTITHHASVTQCLGSIGGHVWYIGVAKSSLVESEEVKSEKEKIVVQSNCGHLYVPPGIDDVRVFRIEGPKFIKLNRGTWHAGPLFKADEMYFYTLMLSDTNEADHTEHSFKEENGVTFSIDE